MQTLICESGGKYSLLNEGDYSPENGRIYASLSNYAKARELFSRLTQRYRAPVKSVNKVVRPRLDIAALNQIVEGMQNE